MPYINTQKTQGRIMNAFNKCYEDYSMVAKLLDRVFDYLNRYYLKGKGDKAEFLGVTAMKIFI